MVRLFEILFIKEFNLSLKYMVWVEQSAEKNCGKMHISEIGQNSQLPDENKLESFAGYIMLGFVNFTIFDGISGFWLILRSIFAWSNYPQCLFGLLFYFMIVHIFCSSLFWW